MVYKPGHVVDLESGAIISAVIHPADQVGTTTLATTPDDTQAKLCASGAGKERPALTIPLIWWWTRAVTAVECCRHCRIPAAAKSASRNTRNNCSGKAIWRHGNCGPLKSCKGKALLRARGEKEARSFAHCLDRDGMRRTPSGGLSIERSAPSSMSPCSIWGYCGGPCLVLAQQKAGPLLKPG